MEKQKVVPHSNKTIYKKATGQYMTAQMRALFREGVEFILPNLIALGKGDVQSAPHSVQVRAAELICKYAIGQQPIMMFEKMDIFEVVARVTSKHVQGNAEYNAWAQDLSDHMAMQL